MSCNSDSLPYSTEETYIPIIDSLGPFHDETILSTIDKLLYFLGAQRMATATKSIIRGKKCREEDFYETCDTFRSGIKSPPMCAPSPCAFTSRTPPNSKCCLSQNNINKIPSPTKSIFAPLPHLSLPRTTLKEKAPHVDVPSLTNSMHFLEHPMVQEIICPICGGISGKPDTTKLKKMFKDYEDYKRNPIKATLRHSFSFCSQAIRKLKRAFSDTFQLPKTESDLDWFWTRRREEGGHHILEIYENSDLSKSPTRARLKENPSLILVVTPSGIVMPFEPVKWPN